MIAIRNEADMIKLAQDLASQCQAGDCFALHGDLGAGKSFLARAIMRALGVSDEALPSPTFAIIQEYAAAQGETSTALKIAHMDWYRLEDEHDVANLGVDEYFAAPWISLIEWSERAPALLPSNTTHIYINLVADDMNARLVKINP